MKEDAMLQYCNLIHGINLDIALYSQPLNLIWAPLFFSVL
jgi:hypothetical protein